MENNQENEIVIEAAKGQLEEEGRRRENLQRRVEVLEETHKNDREEIEQLRAEVQTSKELEITSRTKLEEERKENEQRMQELTKEFEQKLTELQESHIEGELVSAVRTM